jgi:uncharacterized protein (TIGR02444 family)
MRHSSPTDASAGEAFWRFSLALYARSGVAGALLNLQDRCGHDVNLILYALWLGVCRSYRLDAGDLAAAEDAVAAIKGVAVAPLRQLRRQLKDSADPDLQALRRRAAGLELAAERRVQYRLATLLSGASAAAPGDDPFAVAGANLDLYLSDDCASPEAELLLKALAAQMCRDRG